MIWQYRHYCTIQNIKRVSQNRIRTGTKQKASISTGALCIWKRELLLFAPYHTLAFSNIKTVLDNTHDSASIIFTNPHPGEYNGRTGANTAVISAGMLSCRKCPTMPFSVPKTCVTAHGEGYPAPLKKNVHGSHLSMVSRAQGKITTVYTKTQSDHRSKLIESTVV